MGDVGITEFFAATIPRGKAVIVGKTPEADDDVLDTIHLSQVALGPEAVNGRHVVWVEYGGQKAVIGSLTPGTLEQFQIDFPVNREIRISHSGKSDVYVTGYTTHHFLTYGTSEEELDSGAELTSDDEEVPTAIPLANGVPGGQLRGKKKQGKQEVRLDDDYDSEEDSDYEQAGDEEGESDSEASSGDEDMPEAALLQGREFSDMDDSDEEDEESSEEEEGEGPQALRNTALRKTLQQAAQAAAADTSEGDSEEAEEDDDNEDEDEEDSDDEDEWEEEEEEAGPAATPKVGAKRQAAAPPVKTSQKKAKAAAAPATPASPTKGGMGQEQYEADLTKFLKTNGPTKLAVLGSQVKRAPGLPKMKKFLEERSSKFAVDEQSGMVELK